MNVERWKSRSSPTRTSSTSSLIKHDVSTNLSETKAPRALTRALRSLSNSSMDSISTSLSRSSSTRRLQKTPSNSSSMLDRLQRKVSNHSPTSDRPGSPMDCSLPYYAMEVVQSGPLKPDVSLLKTRSEEYLVLSEQVLVKFGSGDAARVSFPQLNTANLHAQYASSLHRTNSRLSYTDIRLEIPLRSIVAVFDLGNRAGIEIWWFSPWPKLAYSRAHFYFALSEDRDVWLASIHRACRLKPRQAPGSSLVSDNLKSRIDHIVRAAEGSIDAGHQSVIFPVARRTGGQKGTGLEEASDHTDISSFFLVIGPCMCHFIEVLKADHATAPGDLRVKAVSHGTVTLTRVRASVVSHEHRFVMCFRSPFGRESRMDLASSQYRRIIDTLTKAERNLKPMWPQHFQQVIFDIKGLPPPLQLTSGNDLGGLRRSLDAYCAAFQVPVPNWTIDWSPPPQPAFRLLPLDGQVYSPLQLLAVFRALRFNNFFKAISFRGVDLSPLAGKNDKGQYADSLASKSLNGMTISEDHHESLLHATILEQEIHALLFASESIRSLDMSNVLGLKSSTDKLSRSQKDLFSLGRTTSEILQPLVELLRRQMCICHSFSLSGNPIASSDLDDLAHLLIRDQNYFRRLDFSQCSLGDVGLSTLWASLAGQADSLEWIDTSNNQGVARFETIRDTLSVMKRLSKLKIAGNTRILSDESLFDEASMRNWELQELDLSGITLNAATVDTLATYLETNESKSLQLMRLSNSGLTGTLLARLFCAMGKARPMELHINGSRLDEGIDDLCAVIARGYGPWCLVAQMIEFAVEASYIKLLRALTVNQSIESLNLAGTSTPEAASSAACQAISDFFAQNCRVRFLDISGFASKLDEGRLGREFSRALIGLGRNASIEHLRVRSQMLNVNIGDLAEAISENKTIQTLDCEGNDLNLSNYRHLVSSLEQNSTIRSISAFSTDELGRALSTRMGGTTSVALTRKPSVLKRFKYDKHTDGNARPGAKPPKVEWEAASAHLERILRRNQGLPEQELAEQGDGSSQEHRRVDATEVAFCTAFGGLPLRDFEMQRAKGLLSVQDSSQAIVGEWTLRQHHHRQSSLASRDLAMRPASLSSSSAASSPSTEEASNGSVGAHTPPDFGSPTEHDFGLATPMFDDLSEATKYTLFEGHDVVDDGLQMKRYRRYMGDPTSRIDEEDGLSETTCEHTSV